MPGDVLFDFDRTKIRADAKPVLAKVAELIQKTGTDSVHIDGHPDAKGDDRYNLALPERRAAERAGFRRNQTGRAQQQSRRLGRSRRPATQPPGRVCHQALKQEVEGFHPTRTFVGLRPG
ncbi:MAG: OmpA family protein [Candidatus Competibacter sp.]|nr:OmpA family protein [Candidatus Competibacter sp.]